MITEALINRFLTTVINPDKPIHLNQFTTNKDGIRVIENLEINVDLLNQALGLRVQHLLVKKFVIGKLSLDM